LEYLENADKIIQLTLAVHQVIWRLKLCAEKIILLALTSLPWELLPMSLCLAKDHIMAKIGNKLNKICLQNKLKSG
jgi:hypothetical protein